MSTKQRLRGDDVAVWLPGLHRPLYGQVLCHDIFAKKVRVQVHNGSETATIEIDQAKVSDWSV